MRLYEYYQQVGNTKITQEFFILQPDDVPSHTAPEGYVLELVGLNRLMEVLGDWFLGSSLEGLNPNTLRNASLEELQGLIAQLKSTGDQVDRELAAKLNDHIYRYEAYLKGPQ